MRRTVVLVLTSLFLFGAALGLFASYVQNDYATLDRKSAREGRQ